MELKLSVERYRNQQVLSFLKIMFIIILSLFLQFERSSAGADCKILKNRWIYFNIFQWKLPSNINNEESLVIKHNEIVRLSCENGFVNNDFPAESYTFECLDGKFNRTLHYEDIMCKSDFHKNTKVFKVSHFEFKSDVFGCNAENLDVYQVKTRKDDGSLKHLYTVCYDTHLMRPKFVVHLKKNEIFNRRNEARKDVWGFDYFGGNAYEKLKLSEGYTSKIQKKRMTASFPQKYKGGKKFPYTFNRGHLAPYTDFIDDDDKKASCEYINVAPQWKEFNGHSWSVIERETRELISVGSQVWEIYTGVYGSIPSEKGPLFVSSYVKGNQKQRTNFVPVPKLYWKLLYNAVNRNDSRVFVGVNNPELYSPEMFTPAYLICQPRIRNGKLFRGSQFYGFTYECSVDEFIQKIGKEENILRLYSLANHFS